jgi:predicted outer membrane repeat protein
MSFTHTLLSWFGNSKGSYAEASRRIQLSLESLDDRITPSTLTVTSALDPSVLTAGTLRYAVNQANEDAARGVSDKIVFNTAKMGTDTIALSSPLELMAGKGTITIDGGGNVAIGCPVSSQSTEAIDVDSGAKVKLTGLSLYGEGGYGWGIYDYYGKLTVDHCTFSNLYGQDGGGIENYYGNVTVKNCTFSGDYAYYGGGIYNYEGKLSVNNSTFYDDYAYDGGGGIYNYSSYAVKVSNSTFQEDSAYNGGGIDNAYGPLTVKSCYFSYDTATEYGGGIYNEPYGNLTLSNSTFAYDQASYGGAIANDGYATVRHSTFTDDSASYGGAIYNDGYMKVSYSNFSGNYASVSSDNIYNIGTLKLSHNHGLSS